LLGGSFGFLLDVAYRAARCPNPADLFGGLFGFLLSDSSFDLRAYRRRTYFAKGTKVVGGIRGARGA
jgi:hypothetical protein